MPFGGLSLPDVNVSKRKNCNPPPKKKIKIAPGKSFHLSYLTWKNLLNSVMKLFCFSDDQKWQEILPGKSVHAWFQIKLKRPLPEICFCAWPS